MTTCINLSETFGQRYRVTFDPAYSSRSVPRDKLDPWMMQIPCRGGITIYPHGGNMLAVEVDYHRGVAKALTALPGIQLQQDGDREKTFVFPSELFDRVAAIVKPKARRRASEKQRAVLAAGRLAGLEALGRSSG
jgi:hypothetical protein